MEIVIILFVFSLPRGPRGPPDRTVAALSLYPGSNYLWGVSACPARAVRGREGEGWDRRVKLRLQIESELPLLGERRAAHFHRQAAVPRAPAVQAQIAAHMPQFGVVVDLLPFLQWKHNDGDVENQSSGASSKPLLWAQHAHLSAVVLPAALQFDLWASGAIHHRQAKVHVFDCFVFSQGPFLFMRSMVSREHLPKIHPHKSTQDLNRKTAWWEAAIFWNVHE